MITVTVLRLHLATIDATHHQAFLAPVELEGLSQVELQGHEGFDVFACICPPGPNKVGDTGIPTGITAGLDLHKQYASRAPVLFVAAGIGLEGLFQFSNKSAQLAKPRSPAVIPFLIHWCNNIPIYSDGESDVTSCQRR